MAHADAFTSIDKKSDGINPIIQDFRQTAASVRGLLQQIRGKANHAGVKKKAYMF